MEVVVGAFDVVVSPTSSLSTLLSTVLTGRFFLLKSFKYTYSSSILRLLWWRPQSQWIIRHLMSLYTERRNRSDIMSLFDGRIASSGSSEAISS